MLFEARPAVLFVAMGFVLGTCTAMGQAQVGPLPPGMGNAKGGVVLPPPPPGYSLQPLNFQPPSPRVLELIKLEEQFAADVAKGGGAAFAKWFADDGVTLNNGQAPVVGKAAIESAANWKPDRYKLSWFVEGAAMGDAGDAAYTWGHYDSEAASNVAGGPPVTHGGRYVTFWKKVNGTWKVALEASAEEPVSSALPVPGSTSAVPGTMQYAPGSPK